MLIYLVLILIVEEDSLIRGKTSPSLVSAAVLILIVEEDSLILDLIRLY